MSTVGTVATLYVQLSKQNPAQAASVVHDENWQHAVSETTYIITQRTAIPIPYILYGTTVQYLSLLVIELVEFWRR